VNPLCLDPRVDYREIRTPPLDPATRSLAEECFAAQREAVLRRGRAPSADESRAREAVSDATLEALLRSGRRVGGIADEREVATGIPFNVRNADDVVWSRDVVRLRRRLDAALAPWVVSLFDPATRPVLFPSGHWWYPAGTYLGWHTNERFPGWRLYLSHAVSPGRSFFRYRDPDTGVVATSPDEQWDLRLFHVTAERPLWHAVYAGADRYSIGWIVRPWSVYQAALHAGRRVRNLFTGQP
jgi:hypothetical protein